MVSSRRKLVAMGALLVVALFVMVTWMLSDPQPFSSTQSRGVGVETITKGDESRVQPYDKKPPSRAEAPVIHMKVMDVASGAPVVGARVSVLLDGVEVGRVAAGGDGEAQLALSAAMRVGASITAEAVATGYGKCRQDVLWGQDGASVILSMVSDRDVSGRVVDQYGAAVSMCRVAILGLPGSDACETGDDGSFRLRAAHEGVLHVLVSPKTNRVLWKGPWVHDVKTGAEAKIILYREERAWCGIEVSAVSDDGNVVVLRECELVPGGDIGSVMLETFALAVTGGTARNDQVPSGDWVVCAVAQNAELRLEERHVTLVPGQIASVVVKPWRPARLVGTVVGGPATAGGIVVLNPSHGVGVSAGKRCDGMAVVDGDGSFAFEDLRLGCDYYATFRKGASIAIAKVRAGAIEPLVLRACNSCSVVWDIGDGLPVDGVIVARGVGVDWSVKGLTDPRQENGVGVRLVVPAGPCNWTYSYLGVKDGMLQVLAIAGSEDCSGKIEATVMVRR
jgi:hypothetical protein